MTNTALGRSDRDDALDGLRAIAALLVVFYHCGVEVSVAPIFIPGFTGVHLFFVLSGYLIARPFLARLLAEQPLPSLRRYAVRRFVRIYPTYLVALAMFIAIRAAGHLHPPSRGDIIRHVLLVFNWGPPAEFRTINIVMWTLVIEAQFYVILPLVLSLAKRLPGAGSRKALFSVVAFIAVGLFSRGAEYLATTGADVRFRLPFSFLDLFGAGMLAALVELKAAEILRARQALRIGLLLLALLLMLGNNYWLAGSRADWLNPPNLALVCLYPFGVCCAFATILLCVRTRARPSVRVLTSAPLTFIGRISYSMYLYHVGVGYFLLTRLPHGLGSWLGAHPKAYALAQLGPVILCSYIAYLAVERPSLRWIERYSLRARESKPLASS